ncbi:MAG TPA: TolC family protein, partial [Bacteroidales bacterium]|nr:TolC family protein [Bacteroidales bacterium]
ACLRDQKKYEIHLSIYEQLVKLASADSIRLNAGDATGLDAMQSSLEAMAYLTEVMQSLAEMQNSGMDLMQLQGKKFSSSLDMASGDFPDPVFHFSIDGLLEKAFENRAELLIAVKSQEVSEKNLGLLRANRAFEFNLEAGYSYNSIVLNEIAPAPAFNAVTAGLSFPIKFSGMNRGEIRAAEAEIRQNQELRNETELQIYTEMMQAYNNFITQAKKAEQFSKGLAETAGRILQGRIYAYQRGETGLVDVLNAQRTFMDLQLSQLDTWFDYTAALIEVERAAGIWDLPE